MPIPSFAPGALLIEDCEGRVLVFFANWIIVAPNIFAPGLLIAVHVNFTEGYHYVLNEIDAGIGLRVGLLLLSVM